MQAPKGPNALHMIGYMNADEEEQDYLEEGTSSKPNIDVKAIEDQFDHFVSEMQKYDQILSDVAKNIQQIDGEKEFITDFYPPFIWESTYEEEQQKKVVANSDPELAKIINNLEKNNKTLKDDMRAWVLEFAKTAKLSEVLISENKVLRQSITQKNKELVRLIESIGQAENEDITELAENLQVLREENGVLKEHLWKLKQQLSSRQGEEERIDNAMRRAEEDLLTLEKQKCDAQDEQQHLSKTLELVEQWSLESERRRKRVEKEKEQLTLRKREYQEEKGKIERQLELCNKERNDLENGLKRQYTSQESQKYRLMEEIHDLGDMIARSKNQGRYFEEQTLQNNKNKKQYEDLSKKYQDKVKGISEELSKLQKDLEKAQQTEIELDCQLEIETYDIDLLKRQLKQLEDRQRQFEDEALKSNKRHEQARNRQLAEWDSKLKQNKREQHMKLQQQKAECSSREKELQRWEAKVFEQKQDLKDLKSQMVEIKANQTHLAKLKSELAQQKP